MRKRYRKKGNKNYIGHIIAISILALVVAYPMGRYFETLLVKFGGNDTRPVVTNPQDPDESNQEVGGSQLKLPAIELTLIQNGVFSTLGGAQTHGQNLSENEFDAIIIEDDSFRVITGLFLNRESALEKLNMQREFGFDNFLADYNIPETTISVASEDEEHLVSIEQTLLVFEEVLENTQEYFLSGEVKTLKNNIEVGLEDVEEETMSDIISIIHKYNSWSQTLSNQSRNEYFSQVFTFLKKHISYIT